MDFGRRNSIWDDQGPNEANTKVSFSRKLLLLVITNTKQYMFNLCQKVQVSY